MREIALNGIPIGLRDEIFRNAKAQYTEKYINFDCKDLKSESPDIVNSYKNYISAVREILGATF